MGAGPKSQKVYLKLKRNGDYWEAAGVSETKPALGEGEVFITGKKKKWGNGVEYGIERYYVPEGRGPEIERMMRTSKISVEVSVDRFGSAAINRLLVDGKEL